MPDWREPTFVPPQKMCFNSATRGVATVQGELRKIMLRKIALASAFLVATVAPALADASSCSEPIAPAAVNGATATAQQMKDAHADVVNFIKASDDFQECIGDEYKREKAQAAVDKKPMDPTIADQMDAKIQSNQGMKEKVGNEYNAAVVAYKTAHP
jgi:hypothetical protein